MTLVQLLTDTRGAKLATLAGLVGMAAGCSAPANAQVTNEPAPLAVQTAVVTTETLPKTLILPGSLRAFQEALVAADRAGRVVATFIERGEPVRAREPLVRLDSRALALGTVESRAQAFALVAQQENAARECQRAEQLFQSDAISRSEFDRMTASCTATRHSVDAAKARQKIAEQAVGDAIVRAPFEGRVAERLVTVGEYVNVGARVAKIVDVSKLRLEIEVPESASGAVKEGLNVEFAVAAFPGTRFLGKVVYIGPVVDQSGRAQVIEALVENKDERLKPGMFATSELSTGSETLPVIPLGALAGTPASRRIFVVKDHRLEERVVLAGEPRDGKVPLKNGVVAGEQVVLNPAPSLRDGMRVK